jgi:hypothetical protein
MSSIAVWIECRGVLWENLYSTTPVCVLESLPDLMGLVEMERLRLSLPYGRSRHDANSEAREMENRALYVFRRAGFTDAEFDTYVVALLTSQGVKRK